MVRLVAVSLLAVLSFRAQQVRAGPSFECSMATKPIEKLICNDDRLSAVDAELARVYVDKLRSLSKEDADVFRQSQRDWLGRRFMECPPRVADAASCLVRFYKDRIASVTIGCKADASVTLADQLAELRSRKPISRLLGFSSIAVDIKIKPNYATYCQQKPVVYQSMPVSIHADPNYAVYGVGCKGEIPCPFQMQPPCVATTPDGVDWLVQLGDANRYSYTALYSYWTLDRSEQGH